MSEYGPNAYVTGSLIVDGDIDLGSGDDDVNLDSNTLFVDADQDKVGIGTTSPSHKFDVNGDIRISGNDIRDNSGNPAISFDWSANTEINGSLTVDGDIKVAYDGSNDATLSVNSSGYLTVTPSGGFASIAGQFGHRKYIKATMSNGNTIGTSESGAVVMQSTVSETPSDVIINLPATAAGVVYTFIYVGSHSRGFQISPNSSDKIMGSIINAAGGITTASNGGGGTDNKDLILGAANNSTTGNRVTLIGDGSNGWVILDGYGDWTFES